MTNPVSSGSEVVRTLEHAAIDAWKRWRRHVNEGTAATTRGLQAYDDSQLANAAWVSEVNDRLRTTTQLAAAAMGRAA